MCGNCVPQFHVRVCGTIILSCNQWELEAFSLFLVFSVQTNQTKRCIWTKVAANQKKFQHWNMPSLFKLVWSPFSFCRLSSLFQVEVFEAIQHILRSHTGWIGVSYASLKKVLARILLIELTKIINFSRLNVTKNANWWRHKSTRVVLSIESGCEMQTAFGVSNFAYCYG